MNPLAIERANERLRQAAEGRTEPAVVEAALERARYQVESLAEIAAQLEATLPDRVGEAVQTGLRQEVLPVAKHLAEVRGLSANMVRRLERLEGDLLAERHARVDDLALLIDLIASGWKGVDERLARLEHVLGAASLPGFGPQLDLTAERRGELTRDREAEAGPVAVPRPERPEDALLLLPRDAGPTVVDGDADGSVGLLQGETDAASIGRPAKRIRKQVRDHLQHTVAVGLEDRPRRDRAPVVDPTAARLLAERRVGTVDESFHVDLLAP